jgi:ABC-type hemin transport system substrate-binding protein
MNAPRFATTATQFVEAFGTTAHSAIDACREGGDRLGELAAERWDRAFKEASPRLKPETRRNATNARKVFARYYQRGLEASTTGAGTVVDTLVEAAGTAIERAAAYQSQRTSRG